MLIIDRCCCGLLAASPSRSYQFPVRIIHAAFIVSHQVVIVEQGHDHIGLYWPTNLLLMALACLHVW